MSYELMIVMKQSKLHVSTQELTESSVSSDGSRDCGVNRDDKDDCKGFLAGRCLESLHVIRQRQTM